MGRSRIEVSAEHEAEVAEIATKVKALLGNARASWSARAGLNDTLREYQLLNRQDRQVRRGQDAEDESTVAQVTPQLSRRLSRLRLKMRIGSRLSSDYAEATRATGEVVLGLTDIIPRRRHGRYSQALIEVRQAAQRNGVRLRGK